MGRIIKPFRGALLNKSHPLARGLVGAWLMNEQSGGKAWDYSGNEYVGTLTNGPSWTPDGLEFTGTEHVLLPAVVGDLIADKGSVVCIWHHDGTTADGAFFDTRLGSDDGWDIKIGAETANHIGFTLDTGSLITAEFDLSGLAAGEQLVAATYDGAKIKLIVPGFNTASNSQTGTASMSMTAPKVGNQANDGAALGAGRIMKAVYIYNRALTASEIASLHREPYQMFVSEEPVWTFGEDGGTTSPSPTTLAPTTLEPTTVAPTSLAPTTLAPTTLPPTTIPATTLAPTTPAPTTVGPTTLAPTTQAPTTLFHTTPAPATYLTTLAPTTPSPFAVRRRGIKDFGFSFRDRWRN